MGCPLWCASASCSKAALREVYAHATLNRMGAHENIVRHYSVWREGGHLYIQNEYCDRGNLDVRNSYTEAELRDILHQVAKVAAALAWKPRCVHCSRLMRSAE